MILLLIIAILLCLLTVLVLERNIRNRRIFFGFCIIIAVAVGSAAFFVYNLCSRTVEVSPSTVRHITSQQQIFDDWYTDYKKKIDHLDYNWNQFHLILKDFQQEDIDLDTANMRLSNLEKESTALQDELLKMTPPISLDDANYDLSTALLKKTQDYSATQLQSIKAVHQAADPKKIRTNIPGEQYRILYETMLETAPDKLFTAVEINQLRDNLTIPTGSQQ